MINIFLSLAEKVLSQEHEQLEVLEIWEIAKCDKYVEKIDESWIIIGNSINGKTPWYTLGSALSRDIKENPRSIFGRSDEEPYKYFLLDGIESTIRNKCCLNNGVYENVPYLSDTDSGSDSVYSNVVTDVNRNRKQQYNNNNYLEKDLHQFLTYFMMHQYYVKVHMKTIHHEQSSRSDKNSNLWKHPDMVGCYYTDIDLRSRFNNDAYNLMCITKANSSANIKLFSFEIKKELKTDNLKKSFFQALSNSSWANEGYLVASEIDNDEKFIKELKRLSNSYGIGIIELNIYNPKLNRIVYPAKERETLDWETINFICENPDFNDFIKSIKEDIEAKRIRGDYDEVKSLDELNNFLALQNK